MTPRMASLLALIIAILLMSTFVTTPPSEAAEPTVTRTSDLSNANSGQQVTIEINQTGVSGFHAVKESLGELELVSNTADGYEAGVFIMIQSKPFEYVVKIPATAKPCDTFEITGAWWTDPGQEYPVEPDPFVIKVPCNTAEVVAHDDRALAMSGVSQTINVLANDEGEGLKITSVTSPQHGTTATSSDRTVSYKSNVGYDGPDTFQYTIEGSGGSDTGKVSVSVNPIATGTAPFKLLPASSTQPIGKKFVAQVWTNAHSGQAISGVEVYIGFDATRLQVVDSDSVESGLQIKPMLTSLNTPIKNQADNGVGRISFASGTFVTPYPTGTFLVAEITFVGIEAGPQPTEIKFSFEPGRVTTASVTGSVVTGSHENAQVLLTDVKLVGIVQLEGGDRPTPGGWEVPVTVRFFEPGMDTPLRTCNTSTVKVADGAMFECSAVSGFFDITVDSIHVLANIKRRVELPNPGASNQVNFGILLEGDANDDGVVDVRDFTLLADGFGPCLLDTRYATNIDFDRNGCVNILDFTLLSKNFLKREPVPVS